MEEVTENFDFLRYVPLFLALLVWANHFYVRSRYNKFDSMRRFRRRNDLLRSSAAENKQDTLNQIIKAEERRVDLSLKLSVMFSLIAVFWLFYIR